MIYLDNFDSVAGDDPIFNVQRSAFRMTVFRVTIEYSDSSVTHLKYLGVGDT